MSQTLTRTGMTIPSSGGADGVHSWADLRIAPLWLEAYGLIFLPPGLDSARPAASAVGRIYKPTDVPGVFYYDTGSTWETIGGSAATDAAAGVGSLRTLGAGSLQAASGAHTHGDDVTQLTLMGAL